MSTLPHRLELSYPVASRAPLWSRWGWSLAAAFGAVLLGVGVAMLTRLDVLKSQIHPLHYPAKQLLDTPIAGLWVLTALLVAGALVAGVKLLAPAFRWRYDLVVVGIFASGSITGINVGPLDAFEVSFVFLSAFWLCSALIEHRRISIPRIALALLLLLTLCTFASVISGRATSFFGLHTLLSKYALVMMLADLITTHLQLQRALRMLVIASVIAAVVAIATSILYRFTGIEITFDDLAEFHYKDTPIGRMLRATAFRASPQSLGHLLVLGLSVLLLMPMRLHWRVLGAGLLLTGAVSTWSTGTILSAGAVFALFWFFDRPANTLLYLTLAAGAAVVVYATGFHEVLLQKFFIPVGQSGMEDRIGYIQVAAEAIERSPYLGVGLKNFSRMLELPVHNAYLQMTAEMGIFCGVVFISLIVYAMHRAVRGLLATAGPDNRRWLKGVVLGMIGLSIHFLVEPLYSDVLSWSFIGIAVCAGGLKPDDGQRDGASDVG